jgi:hypothetical protein
MGPHHPLESAVIVITDETSTRAIYTRCGRPSSNLVAFSKERHMSNPQEFKLPHAENASFAISSWPYPPNVDPAFILRYFKDELINPAVGSYLTYMARVSNLEAEAARARADFHQALAKLHG